jgi:OOP family OmpA-OmpF porin
MKTLLSAVAAGSLALIPALSAAQTPVNYSGLYLGGGIGQFNLNVDNFDDIDDAIGSVLDADDNAWKIFGGYRFTPHFAVELAYIDLGQPGDQLTSGGTHGNYEVDIGGFAPSLVGILPLGGVELFAKIGMYYYDLDTNIDLDGPGPDIDTSHSHNDFLWGGGVSFVVAQRVELRAEYELIDIENAGSSDAFWLNAAWRF